MKASALNHFLVPLHHKPRFLPDYQASYFEEQLLDSRKKNRSTKNLTRSTFLKQRSLANISLRIVSFVCKTPRDIRSPRVYFVLSKSFISLICCSIQVCRSLRSISSRASWRRCWRSSLGSVSAL